MYKIRFYVYSTHCFRRYEVLNVVLLKVKVFLDNSPRGKASSYRRFEKYSASIFRVEDSNVLLTVIHTTRYSTLSSTDATLSIFSSTVLNPFMNITPHRHF